MWSSERSRGWTAAVTALAATTSASRVSHAQTAVPPAPPVAVVTAPVAAPPAAPRPRSPLVWGGASVFALSYIASAFSATTGYPSNDDTMSSRTAMWVPFVGPFITLDGKSAAWADALFVIDGLAQIGGMTLFVYGLTCSAPVVSPRDASSQRTLSFAPLIDGRTTGASVVGTF